MDSVLLSVADMYRADRLAMAGGIPGPTLMERAGEAVVNAIVTRWSSRPTTILCGPGNNGGDGFVIARRLSDAGWPVRVALLGDRGRLTGDAAWAADSWQGPLETAEPACLDGCALAVDALFGAGLSRPLDGIAAALVARLAKLEAPVVAVDIPSGVRGDDGQVQGAAARADLTVTFFRRKPGHLLFPGRERCGEIVVADIGIPETVLREIAPKQWENGPTLWAARYPWPKAEGHKYSRGHVLIPGGAQMTGAARLAALAALRIGAGLVTIAAPRETVAIYAATAAALIVHPIAVPTDFAILLDDPRRNAVLLGPGGGVDATLRDRVRSALERSKAGVLDADVFTSFAGQLDAMTPGLSPRWLLTPHEGEFARLFPDLRGGKPERVRMAARRCNATILLKGPDTVIAHPDGRLVINCNAPPDLATAGSGDVLAGIAVGLIAQGMDGFDAGCAAAWLHGELGQALGPGLIADDLPAAIPALLRRLRHELNR